MPESYVRDVAATIRSILEFEDDFNEALDEIVKVVVEKDWWRNPLEPLSICEILYLKDVHERLHRRVEAVVVEKPVARGLLSFGGGKSGT